MEIRKNGCLSPIIKRYVNGSLKRSWEKTQRRVMQFLKGINFETEKKFSATTSEKGLLNFTVLFLSSPYCIINWTCKNIRFGTDLCAVAGELWSLMNFSSWIIDLLGADLHEILWSISVMNCLDFSLSVRYSTICNSGFTRSCSFRFDFLPLLLQFES